LANQVSGNGSNWTKTDYTGVPQQLQVGQTVDYRGMTTVVPTNAYIVTGTGHTDASVNEQFSNATKILNSQGVPITFDVAKQTIEPLSTGKKDLTTIPVGDASYNSAFLATAGQGIVAGSGERVSFYDPTGQTFTYVFTGRIADIVNGDNYLGLNYEGTTTQLIASDAVYNTGAHETGHALLETREHFGGSNDLMYDSTTNGRNTYISPELAARMSAYLDSYPKESMVSGQVGPQSGNKGR
jgi:hypothetical protein